MTQTIRRKAKSARKTAAQAGKKARAQQAKKQTGSMIDAALASLPVDEHQLHRAFLVIIIGAALAMALYLASLAGVPSLANGEVAKIAGQAGFEVKRVEVNGVKRMNELQVYEKALSQRDLAMPLVDLDAVRNDLLQLSWVGDARVSRQWPDTLVVDIVERTPRAVLRKADRFVLIDDTGKELSTISREEAKGKLIVSGPGAGSNIEPLDHLLDAAPALKPRIAEAEWIGNRRWNLTFETGQVLALPEGDPESVAALLTFARLDGTNRLIGGKVVAFDMRAPDRIYMRVPGRADEERELKSEKAHEKVAAAATDQAEPKAAAKKAETD